MAGWKVRLRNLTRLGRSKSEPVLGIALGGGFARAIAHLGVLQVFEQNRIPIGMIAGVSAGSIIAAAYASGTEVEQIARMARSMKFRDVARWTLSAMGLAASEKMEAFLAKLLQVRRFEQMRIPLAVVASNLNTGQPVIFKDDGDVFLPVRASCSYPGLFKPVRWHEHHLIDGAMTMEVPAQAVRDMGATHVVSVCLPAHLPACDPRNMFQVISRSFQIMQSRTEKEWRRYSDLVIVPEVLGMAWDCFDSAETLIESGERAARAALPEILRWLERGKKARLVPAPAAVLTASR